jgi:AhpD family alkylhydroperoxidase
LKGGTLDARFAERIALATAEANECDYCLSAHTFFGAKVGLGEAEVAAARRGESADARIAEGLRFARLLTEKRGRITAADVDRVRAAGYSDGEIAELVAHVAVNVFTNYFNLVNLTPVDFPHVKPLSKAA